MRDYRELKLFTQAAAPSGNEENIKNVIEQAALPFADEVYTDALGNLIVRKKGNGPKLMFDAHMDEIGLIVTFIEENGLLRVSNLGGIGPMTSLCQRVRFLNGVSGFVCRDLNGEDQLKLSDMYIDIGASSREEAEEKISVGEACVFEGGFSEVGDRLVSKAMDDRAGVFALLETLKRVKEPKNDLYFVFTVAEELGLRGAKAVSQTVNPDFAIAVDVTKTGDMPGKEKMAVSLGKGAAIKIKDSSVLCHPYMKDKMRTVCERENIPYQLEVLESGGTDAGAISVSNGGVPTGAVSIPTRYIHTPMEMIDKHDLEAVIKLLIAMANETYEM